MTKWTSAFLTSLCISAVSTNLTVAFAPPSSGRIPNRVHLGASLHDTDQESSSSLASKIASGVAATLLATSLTFTSLVPANVQPALATDAEGSKQIVGCLLKKCSVPFFKCITNPKCLANVACINTCNNAEDETGCQIKCGDIFENSVVGEFNNCAVSEMSCVPQKQEDGSYPYPTEDQVVPKFDTSLWNGKWYITAGQNKLFDTFPCQVHFFTETEPGKFFGKLNWRIEEPDGEFFSRDAIQEFYQDPKMPAHLINHDNDYLHYEDDWYIVDYAEDNNKEGVPPFAFVYYVGNNDAWRGYGGAVVYTRDSKLPESLRPRLRAAAQKVHGWDFDKDFDVTDNTCGTMENGEALILREKFAGKMAIQTEQQLQAQATMAARMAGKTVQDESQVAQKALQALEQKAEQFEQEIVKDIEGVENELIKDVKAIEKEVVKDVVGAEKEIVKDVVAIEKEVVKDAVAIEKEVVKDVVGFEKGVEQEVSGIFGGKKR